MSPPPCNKLKASVKWQKTFSWGHNGYVLISFYQISHIGICLCIPVTYNSLDKMSDEVVVQLIATKLEGRRPVWRKPERAISQGSWVGPTN